MSDSTPIPAAPEAISLLDPPAVFAAVCEPTRHAVLLALADGAPHSVTELSTRFNRSVASMSKHLIVLRDAHLVRAVTPPDTDGRKQYYQLPALFHSHDADGKPLLDFGPVILRFG